MKDILSEIKQKAKLLNKTIVLPEGEDKRVVKAAQIAADEDLAKIVLLGDEQKVKELNDGKDLKGVVVVNPATNVKTGEYAKILFDCRQGKINKKTGQPEYATVEDAQKYILKDYTMYGALMLKAGDVDGMVSGARGFR